MIGNNKEQILTHLPFDSWKESLEHKSFKFQDLKDFSNLEFPAGLRTEATGWAAQFLRNNTQEFWLILIPIVIGRPNIYQL